MTPLTITQLFDLKGKGAIVTGAAMGIGKAIALRLAEAGAGVMVADIDMEAAGRTVEEIRAGGWKAEAIRADAASEADAGKAARAAVEAFGSLDILVNNAGIYPPSPVLEIGGEEWDRVFEVNLKGMLFYSQAAAREMIAAGRGGKIVNMSSMEGVHPRAELAHYVSSKAGVVLLTQSLALELAPHNILVNAIAPGGIKTPGTLAQGAALLAAGKTIEDLAGARQRFKERLPLRRMGEPDDAARVVLFLASAAADYMTGSVVVVDGGYLLT